MRYSDSLTRILLYKKRGFPVSRRSKPAKDGRMKSSYFEVGVAWGAAGAADQRYEPTRLEPSVPSTRWRPRAGPHPRSPVRLAATVRPSDATYVCLPTRKNPPFRPSDRPLPTKSKSNTPSTTSAITAYGAAFSRSLAAALKLRN